MIQLVVRSPRSQPASQVCILLGLSTPDLPLIGVRIPTQATQLDEGATGEEPKHEQAEQLWRAVAWQPGPLISPKLVEKGLVCKKIDVLDVVVGLALSLCLLLRLARVNALENAQPPVTIDAG